MVLPFRRKDKDKERISSDVDEDINALLDADSSQDSKTSEILPEPTNDEERLHAISDMVVQTCMDIRRGACRSGSERPARFASLAGRSGSG